MAVGGLMSGRGLSEDLSEDFDWAWLGCGDVGGLVGGLVEMSEDLSEDLYKTCNTSYPYRG